MSNKEVIRAFGRGATKGLACHLYIKGNELINYDTVLAWRDENGGFHVNIRKYRVSTSKIQSQILYELDTKIVEKYEGKSCTYWDSGCRAIRASEVY